MDDIFASLREDHDTQRTLLQRLVETKGDSDGREELFARTKRELHTHAKVEERYFYVPLLQADLTQDKARHSIEEHQQIEELVEELENTEFSSPGWLSKARKLQELVVHHLDEEEQEVFQLAGRQLDDEQKRSLARDYQREKAAEDAAAKDA